MDKEEIKKIRVFTSKSESDKAFHTLEGILKGIAIDQKINVREIHELKNWCGKYYDFVNKHPFDEAIPMIMGFIDDNELDSEEYEDLLWFCKSITSDSKYYNVITSDIQKLEGIIHGLLADNIISDEEVFSLKIWLDENSKLNGIFPYDEISSLVYSVLEDGCISTDERMKLKIYFSDFINKEDTVNIAIDEYQKLKEEMHVTGICAINPIVKISNNQFCFTGASKRAKRKDICEIINKHGGVFNDKAVSNSQRIIA
jgi:hypothetical protein